MRGQRGLRAAGAALALLAALSGPAGGQAPPPPAGAALSPSAEARLLREASSHEWRGELDEAEAVLREVLARHPTSTGGLFALERILRARARVVETLPYIDRYLADEPGASGPRYMRIRVLVEVDSLGALERAAAEWFEASPGEREPYHEMARIFRRFLGAEPALQVLDEGRRAVGDPTAFALEMGDVLAQLGDLEGAAREWAHALGAPGADVEGVLQRVQQVEGDRERLAAPVLEALTRGNADQGRRLAAVRLALALERPELAGRVAAEGLAGLPAQAAPGYLRAVAERAEAAGVPELSLWALEALQRTTPRRAPDAALEEQLATQALIVGDTAAALTAHRRRVAALPPANPARRGAWAELIRLEATAGQVRPAELLASFEGFAREFPEAAELDDLAARVAGGLARRGDPDAALALVADPGGPEARLERGWLLLEKGETEGGRDALVAALPGLAPERATEVLQLLAALDRVSARAADALTLGGIRLHRGDLSGARATIDEAVAAAADADRAVLLFQAGQLAVLAADTAAALQHFARIEGAHFESPEAPEAMLRHALLLAADPARTDEARSLLTRLILERPGAAVVPDARHELNRLGRE